jgi:ribosome-associated protein
MDIRKLQRVVVDALEDVKGADIRVFNVMGVTQLFDRVIIASGTSNRQTRALADSVREKVKEAGGDVLSVEGEETGEWVLVDLGDAVVHIMQPAIRAYYDLEEIWGGKPVSLRRQEAAAARAVSDSAQARRASTASADKAPAKRVAKRRAAPAKRAKRPTAR